MKSTWEYESNPEYQMTLYDDASKAWANSNEDVFDPNSAAKQHFINKMLLLHGVRDLNLWLRANINLALGLLTAMAPDRYDSERYAREAANICKELRIYADDNKMSNDDEATIRDVEEMANKTLEVILVIKARRAQNGKISIFPPLIHMYYPSGRALQIYGNYVHPQSIRAAIALTELSRSKR